MKHFLLIISILSSINIFALKQTHSFHHPDFNGAEKSSDYIHFHMESKKAGMITTNFKGVIKKFQASFRMGKDKKVYDAKIAFPIESLDTDNDARNDKMHNDSLDKAKFPIIQIQLLKEFHISSKNESMPARISIRGKEKDVTIKLISKLEGKNLKVNGDTHLSINFLEIPDPSIWIATVRDRIDLKFQFNIPLK